MKIEELQGSIFISCSACMSVLADGLSWANANPGRIAKDPGEADNIIVLSCQVTDLAILNDFRVAERYQAAHPAAQVFISGCLSERRDIPLPKGVKRLEQMRADTPISDKTLVHFEKPFWVPGFEEGGGLLSHGNLFRDMYPLRIGKGCLFNCAYCTIKKTRGAHEVYPIDKKRETEFLQNENVLLVADSPTPKQVSMWCKLAMLHNKPFSIRNVEPHVAINPAEELVSAAKVGVLKIFHSPIQSVNEGALRDMRRGVSATRQVIALSRLLKELGTIIATNVIIDYKDFPDNLEEIRGIYDYVSWNPYFDGAFDRAEAERRFEKYIK